MEVKATAKFLRLSPRKARLVTDLIIVRAVANNALASGAGSRPLYDGPIAHCTVLAIATVLSDMDAEIAALEQKRDKTRDLKQAMMQELLTGRIRLV